MGQSGPKPKPFECPEEHFWYLVGLIATDGCLSSDGRHIDITAKDRDYLIRVRDAIGFQCRATEKNNGKGQIAYHIQLGSRILYDKLLGIGLTPRKSLTLAKLNVPDERFNDFLRGVIDGDGNIRRWLHPTNGHEQWTLRIYGASRPFLHWLANTTERLWSLKGGVHKEAGKKRKNPLYTLKYGKLAAKVILTYCYYPGALALERKRQLAEVCSSGDVGWSKSKTVIDPSSWHKWTYTHTYRSKIVSKVLESQVVPS